MTSLQRKPSAVIYFANGPEAMYQINDWLRVLTEVAKTVPLSFVCRDKTTAQVIAGRTHIPVFHGPDQASTEALFDELRAGVVLYLNQFRMNFDATGYPDAFHVFISHGESDKSYMSQNSLKIFDYFFVAGEVARERVSRALPSIPSENIIPIGRPQLHFPPPMPSDIYLNPDLPTLLYAPTWEGTSNSMAYSSVISHGVALARHMARQEDINFIYRPHPFLGMHSWSHARADQKIRKVIGRARKISSNQGIVVDESGFGWHLKEADWLMTDMSAVAYDWLSTGKPALLCKPPDVSAFESELSEVFPVHSPEGPLNMRSLWAEFSDLHERNRKVESLFLRYFTPAIETGSSQLSIARAVSRLLDSVSDGFSVSPSREHRRPPSVPVEPVWTGKPNATSSYRLTQWTLKRIKIGFVQLLLRQSFSQPPQKKATVLFFVARSDSSQKNKTVSALVDSLQNGIGSSDSVIVAFRSLKDAIGLWLAGSIRYRGDKVKLHWVPTVEALERLLTAVKPRNIFYPQLGPENHYCLRFSGFHHLVTSQRGGNIRRDHNMQAYDQIVRLVEGKSNKSVDLTNGTNPRDRRGL